MKHQARELPQVVDRAIRWRDTVIRTSASATRKAQAILFTLKNGILPDNPRKSLTEKQVRLLEGYIQTIGDLAAQENICNAVLWTIEDGDLTGDRAVLLTESQCAVLRQYIEAREDQRRGYTLGFIDELRRNVDEFMGSESDDSPALRIAAFTTQLQTLFTAMQNQSEATGLTHPMLKALGKKIDDLRGQSEVIRASDE